MGATPKHKLGRSYQLKRRATQKITQPQVIVEKDTMSLVRPHRVSKTTGVFRGKKVIKIK